MGLFSRFKSAFAFAFIVATSGLRADPQTDQVNDFGFKVLREVQKSSGDPSNSSFISPLSIHWALSMLASGSDKYTRTELTKVLGSDKFFTSDWYLNTQNRLSSNASISEASLNLSNRIYPQKGEGFKILPSFENFLKKTFNSSTHALNYVRHKEESIRRINNDIENDTRGMIKDLIPPNGLDETTRLVLTNAIYFKASWEDDFSEAWTTQKPFFSERKRKITVPMMKSDGKSPSLKRKVSRRQKFPTSLDATAT